MTKKLKINKLLCIDIDLYNKHKVYVKFIDENDDEDELMFYGNDVWYTDLHNELYWTYENEDDLNYHKGIGEVDND